MSILKKNLPILFLVLFLVFVPIFSFAQPEDEDINDTPSDLGKIENPIKHKTINAFIKVLLEGVIKISIPIIALAVIYSGFLFVAAQGNSEKLQKAKDALLYTIIGAAILLGAWSISILVSETILAL